MEKNKNKYFDSYKQITIQEKNVVKLLSDREKNLCKDEDVEEAHSKNKLRFKNKDLLFIMRSNAENNCQIYKKELIKTNSIYEENEKKYFPLIEKIKLNEENRISFLKFHFEKFGKYFDEFNNLSKNFSIRFSNYANQINIDEDIKEYDEKYNYKYKNNTRIPREEFLNYDLYRKNLENFLESKDQEDTYKECNLII